MPKRWDFEYIKNFIESEGCELLSTEYKNNVTKLEIRYLCGHVDNNKTFSDFRVTRKLCSACSDDKLKYDDVKKHIESFGCELISETYKNNSVPLKIRFTCGHIGTRTFSKFKDREGKVCRKCAGNKKYTQEEIEQELEKYNFRIEEEYRGAHGKLTIIDLINGYKFFSSITDWRKNIKSSNGVWVLAYKNNIYSLYNISRWLEINGKTFVLCEDNEYKTAKKKLKFKCLECGEEFSSGWDSIKSQGTGCPSCNRSKGELSVANYLNMNGVTFSPEHVFSDCKNIRSLEYDFYITDMNVAIEFQGQGHYFPVDFAGRGTEWAEEEFNKHKKRDQIKRNYCSQNNIKLIEIAYWDFDRIPEILSSELNLN